MIFLCFLQGFTWILYSFTYYSTVELERYGVRCNFLCTSECYIIYLLICRYIYSMHSLISLVSGSHFVFWGRGGGGGAARGITVGRSECFRWTYKADHDNTLDFLEDICASRWIFGIIRWISAYRIRSIRRHGYYLFHHPILCGIYSRVAFINISSCQRSDP